VDRILCHHLNNTVATFAQVASSQQGRRFMRRRLKLLSSDSSVV
jgi:hypothetical protein